MPSVTGDDAMLEDALRHLCEAWAITAERWRDQARSDFEKQHLDGIEDRTRLAARSVKQMENLINEVMRQCR
ncbi:MAG: hypothetical protein H0W83_03565 [Planctomycetes bacterium]|nr:hypothetical protein [Planctomycetota bacterium]